MHVRMTFPYLENDWTECAETWCVVRGPLAMSFKRVEGVRTSARVAGQTHI